MNTLIISTFSCTFEEFKNDISGFITAMGFDVISEYEFVQAGEHKSHLLLNVLDMEALEAEMTSDAAKEWDKKIIARTTSMQLSLLNKLKRLLLVPVRICL